MDNILILADGIEAISSFGEWYSATVTYNGTEVGVELGENEKNPDTKKALQDAFEKLYRDIDKYNSDAMDLICSEGLDVINKDSEEPFDADIVREDYYLARIVITDDDRDVRIEFIYWDRNSDPGDYYAHTLHAAGTITKGFFSVLYDSVRVLNSILLEPHTLSTGDVLEYSSSDVGYIGKVAFWGGREVECFFEPDEDGLGADTAFATIEEILKNTQEFEDVAVLFTYNNVDSYIEEIRANLASPELTEDDIVNNMNIDVASFTANGDFELTFVYHGNTADVFITIAGSLEEGFRQSFVGYESNQ